MSLDPRSSRVEFSISYAGPALDDGAMDVKSLAPALLALGKVCEDANSILNATTAAVAVHVRATKPGSFGVEIELWQSIKSLLGQQETRTAVQILMLLLGGGGVLEIVRRLKGRPAEGTTLEDGSVKIDVKGDNNTVNTLVVNGDAHGLYNSSRIRHGMRDVAAPLTTPGIEKVEIQRDGQVIGQIDSDEYSYFDGPLPENDEDIDEYEGVYYIEKLSFADRYKWTFRDQVGDLIFNASMADQEFMARVAVREVNFADGDALRVRLRRRTAGGRVTHTVLKVIQHQHHPAPRQDSLLTRLSNEEE